MKIHEAIRMNGWPQTFGKFFHHSDSEVVAACALGQAYMNLFPEASIIVGVLPPVRHDLCSNAPFLRCISDCPIECGEFPASAIIDVITHLNDDHGWSLAQIADWVQTIEEAQ